jgi:hypothetical protein
MDLALFLLGTIDIESIQAILDPETVNQSSERMIDSDPVVEHAHLRFRSGQSATLVRARGCTVRVGGTKGTLTIHADGAYMQISRGTSANTSYFLEQTWEHMAPPISATITAFRELRQAIDEPSVVPIRPEEITTGALMLMGCAWSHLQGQRPIRADEVPHDLIVTGLHRGLHA